MIISIGRYRAIGLAVLFYLVGGIDGHAQRIMTLGECVVAAKAGNAKAREAQFDIRTAEEQRRYARSKYLPMLQASAFHFESTDYLLKKSLLGEEWQEALEEINQALGLNMTGHFNFVRKGTSTGLTMIEPLYTGGRITNYNKLADLQVEARNLQKDMAEDDIVQATEALFFRLLELHHTDKTLRAAEQQVESIGRDARNAFDNGIVSRNDLLSVELAQDQLAALRIKLDNGRRLLRRALAQQIGLPDEDIDIDTAIAASIVSPEQLLTDVSSAVESRTEARLLDLNVRRSQLESKIARADMLPVFAVGGMVNYSNLLENWGGKGIGFVVMQLPISSLWSERHEYRRKKIEEQKALDFRKDKREMMSLQIRDAYDNLVSSYQQTLVAAKSIEKADENLRMCREQYRNGMVNMTVVLEAQSKQQQAQTQHVAALSDYLQCKTKYLILTGRRHETLY